MTEVEGSSNTKLLYLNSVEQHEDITSDVDPSREKYFACFPYAYMNGKLHLGHIFSFTKADFTAYFKKLQGFNVLLPFGFHCTGMPISASAQKLAEELKGNPVDLSVANILKSNGFNDPTPFTDPLHWIRTFPGCGIETMKKLHTCIDWRRSFITTEINKYYDSFIRFQFEKLRELNLLAFGKRYSIFCTVDQQACLDHDRRKGEGIKPVEVILRKIEIDQGILLVRSFNTNSIEKIVAERNLNLCVFTNKNRTFIIQEDLYENLKYQIDDSKFIKNIKTSDLSSQKYKIDLTDNPVALKITVSKEKKDNSEYEEIFKRQNEQKVIVESDSFVKIYEPEGLVISRSGSKCVVSLLDQWYIDYSNPEWKERVRGCVKNMKFNDEGRAKFEESIEWIGKWGFSRSFGLGTRIPWDQQYMIDSLSDSTIYMAFYTFNHFLFKDLEGKDEIFPSELLSSDVWNYIFRDVMSCIDKNFELPEKLKKYKNILDLCKKSVEYYYPVDLRVSGKDLIGNHLTFYIFNHVALFDEKYWPRRIYTNGHVMLNSAKMSKSEGNFLSVEDGVNKFGASAMRMCLASCGDTNEDANFVEANANALVLKLYTFVKTVEGLESGDLSDILSAVKINENFADKAFIQMISRNIRNAVVAYENITYRDALKYGFYENLHLIELYSLLGGKNQALIAYGYKVICQLMYPIIPSISNYLLKLRFNGEFELPKSMTESEDMIHAIEYLKDICNKIVTSKKKTSNLKITVGKKFAKWKEECIKIVDEFKDKEMIIAKTQGIFEEFEINKKKGLVFCMDYLKNRDNYIVKFNEFEVLSTFKDYLSKTCCVPSVQIELGDNAEPIAPLIEFF